MVCSEHSQEGALCTPDSPPAGFPHGPERPLFVGWVLGSNDPSGSTDRVHRRDRISCAPPIGQVEDMDKAAFLKQTPLFAGFSDKEIQSVLGTAKERVFAADDAIIKEGHEGGRGFYLLLAGSAEVRRGSHMLATLGSGDYFGEMALLLEDTPRTADVVATSETHCLVITQWDLKALIKSHPEIGIKMMNELARRLRDTDAALSD